MPFSNMAANNLRRVLELNVNMIRRSALRAELRETPNNFAMLFLELSSQI